MSALSARGRTLLTEEIAALVGYQIHGFTSSEWAVLAESTDEPALLEFFAKLALVPPDAARVRRFLAVRAALRCDPRNVFDGTPASAGVDAQRLYAAQEARLLLPARGAASDSADESADESAKEANGASPAEEAHARSTRACGCGGREHAFYLNCVRCGYVHCEAELAARCAHCGADLLRAQPADAARAAAEAKRDRVLQHQRDAQLLVIDDDLDLLEAAFSRWVEPDVRAVAQQLVRDGVCGKAEPATAVVQLEFAEMRYRSMLQRLGARDAQLEAVHARLRAPAGAEPRAGAAGAPESESLPAALAPAARDAPPPLELLFDSWTQCGVTRDDVVFVSRRDSL